MFIDDQRDSYKELYDFMELGQNSKNKEIEVSPNSFDDKCVFL